MSMWRVGREAVRIGDPVLTPLDRSVANTRAADDGTGGPLGDIADTVAKWIPGEVLALYVVGVTLIGAPNWFWLVVGILLAPAVVVLAAFANSGHFPPDAKTGVRAALGFVAMVVWSLTVPASGWRSWSVVRDNPAAVALAAAAVGLIFGLVAEGVSRWVDNRPPAAARHALDDGGPSGGSAFRSAFREPEPAVVSRQATSWAPAHTGTERTQRTEPAHEPADGLDGLFDDGPTSELPGGRRSVSPQPLRMPSIPPLD
jgi:hypothetical protein